jgi:hypothetical protein
MKGLKADWRQWMLVERTVAGFISHSRYPTFQMAEVAVSRQMFAEILSLIARLQAPPAPA